MRKRWQYYDSIYLLGIVGRRLGRYNFGLVSLGPSLRAQKLGQNFEMAAG